MKAEFNTYKKIAAGLWVLAVLVIMSASGATVTYAVQYAVLSEKVSTHDEKINKSEKHRDKLGQKINDAERAASDAKTQAADVKDIVIRALSNAITELKTNDSRD